MRPSPGLRRIATIRLIGPFDQHEIIQFDGAFARYACVLETKPQDRAKCARRSRTFGREREVKTDILPASRSAELANGHRLADNRRGWFVAIVGTLFEEKLHLGIARRP